MIGTARRINQITTVESSPEKAGVGGSIPSLATIESITYRPFHLRSGPNWSQDLNPTRLDSYPERSRNTPSPHRSVPEWDSKSGRSNLPSLPDSRFTAARQLYRSPGELLAGGVTGWR